MMDWNGNGSYGMGASGWLVMSAMGVFWLILLGLVVWLVVRLTPGRDGGTTRTNEDPALDILDRRLASGGIDLESWQAQRAALLGAQRDRR